MWVTDLGHQLPSTVCLDALDVSFGSAPPKEWLPQNVTLRQWDIFTEVPEDLIGVYDIVHVSLFTFVLQDKDITAALGKLLKLLSKSNACRLLILHFNSSYMLIYIEFYRAWWLSTMARDGYVILADPDNIP